MNKYDFDKKVDKMQSHAPGSFVESVESVVFFVLTCVVLVLVILW